MLGKNKITRGDIVCIGTSFRSMYFDAQLYDYPIKYTITTGRSSVYAMIENIVSLETDKVYHSFDVITGNGSLNSKVKIGVKLIQPNFTTINDILYFDPHDVYQSFLDEDIKQYEKNISTLKSIRNMSKTREKKITRILSTLKLSEFE